jgi:GntR family transcriptional repressor for pyruvate dehydrogenase complex
MRISEKIYLELQKDILQGKYRTHSRFPSERELAVKYESSRSAVREAMAKLCQAGLVRTVPQSGTYVTDYQAEASLDLLIQIMKATEAIDADILISLLKYRRMAEPYIAREAALQSTAEDVASLAAAGESLIHQLENDPKDIKRASELDFTFHLEITRATRNLIFQLLFNSFKPIYTFCTDTYYQSPGTPGTTIDFVNNLTTAVADGDGERAYAVMMEAVIYAEHQLQSLTVP